MKREQKPRRRLSRQQVLVTLGLVVLVMVIGGYIFGWQGEWPVDNTSFPKKTLWDWLELLVVPATIAVVTTAGGAWFTRQRAQDTALEAYLDKMSELLIDKQLHREYGRYADSRVVARARTLAVLSQLDGKRKRTVLLFLREARLINKQQYYREGRVIYPLVVGLRGADLSGARLRGAQLVSTDGKEAVSLEDADLSGADLRLGVPYTGIHRRETRWIRFKR